MQKMTGALLAGVVVVAAGLLWGGWSGPGSAVPRLAAEPAAAVGAGQSQEAMRTVRLSVDNMWCASCSYIVHQALVSTPGVVKAEVSGREHTALVTFDPRQATVDDLIAATGRYGYPAALITG